MIVGVVLLFISSVTFASPRVKAKIAINFPQSQARVFNQIGGDTMPTVLPVSRPAVPTPKDKTIFIGSLTAAAAIVVDDKTNTVLFKKNIDRSRSLASITKLMSAIVLANLPLNWSTTTIVSQEDLDSSSHHINADEEYTLEDLWHIALIGSSNSSIKSLIRASGLDDDRFVEQMNKKAAELDLTSLHFVEPTGLDSGNVGNAWAIVRLLKEALKIDKIYRTLQIGEYYTQPLNQEKSRRVWSTDWLLTNWVPSNFSAEEIVGKTGYITESGYNFVVRLSDGVGHAVRVAVLGADSNESRFSEARDLAEWTFGHYLWPDQEGYDKLAE